MRVIVNPKMARVIPKICFAAFVLLLVLAGATVMQVMKYRKYVSVDAVISSVERTAPLTGATALHYSNYITYSYYFDGQKYQAERIELLRWGKKEGKTVRVKCDPKQPQVIQDVYGIEMLLLCTGGSLLIFLFLLLLCKNLS